MAKENLELNSQNESKEGSSTLVSADIALKANQVVSASMQRIRHPLIDSDMILYGFLGELSDSIVLDDFEIHGFKIRFKYRNSERYVNYDIYPKILIDFKRNYFYDLFPDVSYIYLTDASYNKGVNREWGENIPDNKRNFYFFKFNYDAIPCGVSDQLYFVCKYRESGHFKYGLFLSHEVIMAS